MHNSAVRRLLLLLRAAKFVVLVRLRMQELAELSTAWLPKQSGKGYLLAGWMSGTLLNVLGLRNVKPGPKDGNNEVQIDPTRRENAARGRVCA